MSSYLKSFVTALALCLLAAGAGATQYSTRFTVDQRAVYDNNILLSADKCWPGPAAEEGMVCNGLRPPTDSTSYELAPNLSLAATGPLWEARTNARVRFTRFSADGLSSDDQYLGASLQRRGERMQFDLDAFFDRTNTRTQVVELDEFVFNTERIERWSVRPAWTVSVSEKDGLVVSGSYGATNYAPPRFRDYDDQSLSVGWQRSLDEKSQLQLSVYRSSFDSGRRPTGFTDPQSRTDSDTDGLQVSYTRQFSEALTGSFALGARNTDTTSTLVVQRAPTMPGEGNCGFFNFFVCEIAQFSSDSSGFTASVGFDYTSEAWSLSAGMSRSLVPNGLLGGLFETDQFSIDYRRVLSERLEFNFSAAVSNEETIGGSTFARDRWTIEPSLTWQLAQRWRLIGSLRHRLRDFDRDLIVTEADSTAVILRLRYAHPSKRWSR